MRVTATGFLRGSLLWGPLKLAAPLCRHLSGGQKWLTAHVLHMLSAEPEQSTPRYQSYRLLYLADLIGRSPYQLAVCFIVLTN